MKKQKVYNQDVADDEQLSPDCTEYPEAEVSDDNVAEEVEPDADTMTENDEAAEWRDKYVRLQAEFDNFRKRTLREKMDLVQSGGADVLKAMLSVLDDVYRAMEAAENSDDITALREGNKLVAQKFTDALKQRGVTEIEAMGKEFDLNLHEAVAKFPAPSEDMKGKVIDVVQRGYKLGDKILRYTKVVVGE